MHPAYSIIIPAFNEEQWLTATITSVRDAMAQVDRPGEIIVVDNNSTDGTARVAAEHGAQVVFEPVNQISRARNAGGRAARGKYLIFLDADTLLSAELLGKALDNLDRPDCCGGGVVIVHDGPLPMMARLILAMWNRCSVILRLGAGCFLYCTRDGFDATGGFSENVYASEEIWFSRSLARWGRAQKKTFEIITDPPVVTSNRKFHWFSPLQMAGQFLVVLLFPFAPRFRSLCAFWYTRPANK
jgi:glycosyltransferase involved in cell wall biosynthesis